MQGPGGFTALHLAVAGNYTRLSRAQLAKQDATATEHAEVFRKAGTGSSGSGILYVVRQLLAAGASTTSVSKTGLTPLAAAACSGQMGPVYEMLCNRAAPGDPNLRCCHGYTPLMQAAFSKQLEVIPLLLAAGARPGVPAAATDDVELHYAATNTNWSEALVKQVVDAGCPLNPYNGVKGAGCTPLVLASSRGNTKVAAALVAAGADVDLPDKATAMTPLHYAAMGGHLAIIRSLVAAGAALEPVDSYDSTPVQVAANYGQLEACVALVEAGAAWPTGRGAKAAGGDVVTLLVGSKACKKRNLKQSYVNVVLKAAEKRFRSSSAAAGSGGSSSMSRKGSLAAPAAAAAAAAANAAGSNAAAQQDDIDNILQDLLQMDNSSSSSSSKAAPGSGKKSSSKKKQAAKKDAAGSSAATAFV
ncbi:hypothetical protein OEZ85_003509 [Tetradesmus obliquus]|uniref:Uncharacterized protein n=1 Tax=Tetradesmus obliquus TaxID=3088 RepID=A0ABY8UCM6_TETOB|nr:hypothetical protein OEZ85_003509 [Tetradesmus obliquus]